MSTPALSPTERAAVARFGAHDEEILAEIADRMDDEPSCTVEGCDDGVTHVLVCNLCDRQTGVVCDSHADYARRARVRVTHTRCGTTDEMYLLVTVRPV